MEELFKEIAGKIALGVELSAALLIVYGAVEALMGLVSPKAKDESAGPFAKRRRIFVRFGVWLLLALEFELAADIVRTAISPTWTQIGQLGAIAAIRTFLNHFLERDIGELTEKPASETP